MARIRSIKPEFWSSEQVMDCSPMARLLFIGVWNFCDDGGNHTASAKTLKAEIFPGDDIQSSNVQRLLDELSSNNLIVLYSAAGKDYIHVTGWHHQKIEKPTFKHPPFSEDKSAPPRRPVAEPSTPEGRGEEGNKDIVETSQKTVATDILDYLNDKTGRAYKPVEANLRVIAARLRESSLDECRAVIDAKCGEWLQDEKMCQYLRPETLFGATKFAQYVGQLGNSGGGADPFT